MGQDLFPFLIFGLFTIYLLSSTWFLDHEPVDATLNDGGLLLIQRGAGFFLSGWARAVGLEKLATYYWLFP